MSSSTKFISRNLSFENKNLLVGLSRLLLLDWEFIPRLFCLFTDVSFILSTIPCGDDQRLVQLTTDNQPQIMIKKVEADNLWLNLMILKVS
jgi:hypothetical protein